MISKCIFVFVGSVASWLTCWTHIEPSLSPDLAHCIVFLDKALNSLSAFQVDKSLYIGAN